MTIGTEEQTFVSLALPELRCIGQHCTLTTGEKYHALGCVCRLGLRQVASIQAARLAKGETKELSKPAPIYHCTCAACGAPFKSSRATPYGPCCTAEGRKKRKGGR